MGVCLAFCKYANMHIVRDEVRTSSGRGILDVLKREVRGTLKIKLVTARVCRTCAFLILLSRREIETKSRRALNTVYIPFLILLSRREIETKKWEKWADAFQYVYPVGRLKKRKKQRNLYT